MTTLVLINDRYEVKDVLGRGGVGVVYRAFDRLSRREVAVKALRETASGGLPDWFERERGVLSTLLHPNVVEILDVGEFEEDGNAKPYFVMPLLPGRTLYDLIYPAGTPLPPERCVDIISQACRGLHAAHQSGLLHRDIQPCNIFVMRDDAVKLIDFGVVGVSGNWGARAAGALGTLRYMAPEQIQMRPLTARSDIFSLGTVCYEALTGVHPFVREREAETAAAVLGHTPVLACTLNAHAGQPLAQVVAQAMAKDPRQRFQSAAAFADALQQGLRNGRPSSALPAKPPGRVARAQRSFARGDYEFTREILDQLEAEGRADDDVRQLRTDLDEAVRTRQAEVEIATARRYFKKEEHALALRRVSEILHVDPLNRAALSLKREIEAKMNELRVANSLALAAGHLENGEFNEARQLIEDSLVLQPDSAEAWRLLRETERRAVAWPRERREQEALFETAQAAYFEGRFGASLDALEQLAALSRQSRAAGARVEEYQNFGKRVRGDFDALRAALIDARELLDSGDLDTASLWSGRLREQYAQDPDVLSLDQDIEASRDERERESRRAIELRLANEPDLSAQLHILSEAVRARPDDDTVREWQQHVQTQLQRVTEATARANGYESAGRFEYALEEWLAVGDICPAFPGLAEHVARTKTLWEAAREKAKTSLRVAVAEALRQGDCQRAASLLQVSRAEFGDDADYRQLNAVVETAAKTQREVLSLLDCVLAAEQEGRPADIPMLCQAAVALTQKIEPLSERTFAALTATAERITPRDWRVARHVLKEAGRLAPVPATLYEIINREEREEEISEALNAEGASSAELLALRGRMVALLDKYPDETRLASHLNLIDDSLAEQRKRDERRLCVDELIFLDRNLADASDHAWLWETQSKAKSLAAPFAGDEEIDELLGAIGDQVTLFEEGVEALSHDRIQDCYAICDRVLAWRPSHCLFQLLRDRAGARHREMGEDYLARVERWLAGEPDFEKREQILRKAQAEYPFETRYAEELEYLQREREATESLAAKARHFEESGQMAEALAQWLQIYDVNPSYPNLEELIAHCESTIDREERQVKIQRLLPQGQSQLAAGDFTEGYQTLYEAWRLSDGIEDLLRDAAPDLIAAARAVPPANAQLSVAMAALARSLDAGVPIPGELSAQIREIREAEELAACLPAVQQLYGAADLMGALAVAGEFLARFPQVDEVRSLHDRLWAELEGERRQQARAFALDQFQQMENQAANLNPLELLNLKKIVYEIASHNLGDEEVNRRAFALDALFSGLAEVREHLQAQRASQAEEACLRAFEKFPEHPLFEAAYAQAAAEKAERAAKLIQEVNHRLAAKSAFTEQAEILRDTLAQFPDQNSLRDEWVAVNAKQRELDRQIGHARDLEGRRLFDEAIDEWEALRGEYPWYPGVDAEVERLTSARSKEKHDAQDRWIHQLEEAIRSCNYETAVAMMGQVERPRDRTVSDLEERLKECLEKKEASDAEFAEGKRLLFDGDLAAGARALARAHDLQPGGEERTDSIAALLMAHIRANVATDLAACEELLSFLNHIAPDQTLPPDLIQAMAGNRQAAEAHLIDVHRMQEQLGRLAKQAESARSKKSLSSAKHRLHASGLLSSREDEVQRAANELLRKINMRLGSFETALMKITPVIAAGQKRWSIGGVLVGVLLAVTAAATLFLLSQPRASGVPVEISVRPDHATIDIDGQTCVAPRCNFMLKPGEYAIKVRKAGYKDRKIVITVNPGDATPLHLNAALEPL